MAFTMKTNIILVLKSLRDLLLLPNAGFAGMKYSTGNAGLTRRCGGTQATSILKKVQKHGFAQTEELHHKFEIF